MRCWVYRLCIVTAGCPSVRPVCLSGRSTATAMCGWFAAELRRVQQISTDSGHIHSCSVMCLSCVCSGYRHVESRGRRFNTRVDLLKQRSRLVRSNMIPHTSLDFSFSIFEYSVYSRSKFLNRPTLFDINILTIHCVMHRIFIFNHMFVYFLDNFGSESYFYVSLFCLKSFELLAV